MNAPGPRRLPVARLAGMLALGTLASACCPPIQRADELPAFVSVPLRESSVRDGRADFADVFCKLLGEESLFRDHGHDCARWLHLSDESVPQSGSAAERPLLDKSIRVLFVPGIFGECVANLALPFQDAWEDLEKGGIATGLLKVDGRSSSTHNAQQIAEQLAQVPRNPNESLILVGYSKGTSDILEALTLYPAETASVDAVVSIAGAVNGSPVASGTPKILKKLVRTFPYKDCESSVGDPVESLTYAYRQAWLLNNPIPAHVRLFSVAAYTASANISVALRGSNEQLNAIDSRNDGQIIYRDAILPGSTLLALVNADHWAVALPLSRTDNWIVNQMADKNTFPRSVLIRAVIESIRTGTGTE